MVARWCAVIACAMLASVSATHAQTSPKASVTRGWRVPRTPDGRPDLQGFWTNTTAMPLWVDATFPGTIQVSDVSSGVRRSAPA